jgi:L-alanine-DL-glutamate epimerase-like enolase superfamily enzyme
MKITSIDVFALKPRYMPMAMRGVVCRINTDVGIYGYGEAAVSYGKGSSAGFNMIKELAPLLIGQDPMRTEWHWKNMFMETFWGQSGGPIFYSAMSAIDIALMDIKGKAYKVPCYELIGGKSRDKVRAYASQLQLGWVADDAQWFEIQHTPEGYALQAQRAVQEGYTAIKADFTCVGPDGRMRDHDTMRGVVDREMIDTACQRIEAIRKAVGNKIDIIVECHSHTDAISSVQYAQAVEKYGIYYFEEGTYPMNTMTAKNASRKTNIPMANGERIYTRWQYLPFLIDDSIQVVQPEIANCGGITECKKICDLAHIFDASVQVHVCGSPISLAAALQVEATIPNFQIHENHVVNKVNFVRELGTVDMAAVNGDFIIPDTPGIGQELSEYALQTAYHETVQ